MSKHVAKKEGKVVAANKGLKQMTRAGSVPMRTKSGGKGLIRDESKKRLYLVKGEPGWGSSKR